MSRQTWSETLAVATASGTPVTNTTTETILFPNITIPANYMADGRLLRLKAFGQWSSGTGPPTLIWGVKWGGAAGTLIAKSATVTLVASITAAPWELEVMLQVRSNGASGTVMGNGHVNVFSGSAPTVASATGAAGVAPITNGGVTTPAVATLDLTADTALALTIIWSASSTSHTITGLNYSLESMN